MTWQRRVTIAIVVAGVSLAGLALLLKWRDNRDFSDPALQLSRFPAEESIVVSVNFSALRLAGILSPSQAPLEPEYKQFLDGSGFDYRRDLDQVYASFSSSGNYFLAQGRFDWNRLSSYARQQGGSCYQSLCRMQGSTPQRRISFLPVREDVMALAVSTDDLAATRLTRTAQRVTTTIPDAPVWLSLPGTTLRQQAILPPGMRLMLSALTSADRVVVTGGLSAGGMEVRLDASCKTKEDAGVLASQLRNTAGLIREGMANHSLPPDDELARTLGSGSFEQNGLRVAGRWPVARSLLETLTAGI